MTCKWMIIAAVLGAAFSGFAADEIGESLAPAKEKDMGIRVSLGAAPGISESEFQGTTYSVNEDSGGQFEVLFARRHWKGDSNFAWIWGAGFFFSSMSGTAEEGSLIFPVGTEYDLSTFGVMGQGGIALKAADFLILELQPYLGFGAASASITGFTDGGAGVGIFGIKGGAFIPLGERVELGIEFGYQDNAAIVEVDIGSTYDLELTSSGLHASGVLAITF